MVTKGVTNLLAILTEGHVLNHSLSGVTQAVAQLIPYWQLITQTTQTNACIHLLEGKGETSTPPPLPPYSVHAVSLQKKIFTTSLALAEKHNTI